jgi:hypothetical protein
MLRKLGWLAVALFVIADVVLIALALRHTRPGDGASGPVTVTVTTRASASPQDSVTGTTSTSGQARGTGTTEQTTQTSTSTRAIVTAPTPPSSRQPAGPTTSATPATPASSASTPGPVAPQDRLMLDMSSDGSVIRAIRGSCPSSTPATLQVSGDGGRTWSTVDTDSPVILRIGALRGGKLWYIGTDTGCQPQEQDTTDGGTIWKPGSTAGSWYLDTNAAVHVVHGPHQSSDAGCVPLALSGVDATSAVLACTDGDVRTTSDGGDTWSVRSTVAGVVAISFINASHGFALAATGSCAAQVLETDDGAQSWQSRACLTGHRPRGIAAAGGTMLAQVDDTLLASHDGGSTWSPVT